MKILRLRLRQRGLGLRDVGAGHLADVEPVLGLPQLLLQHLDIAAIEVERAVSRITFM